MNTHKILFDDFIKELSKDWTCLEVCFYVDNHPDYQDCWLWKMVERETNSIIYWYGLVKDGSQAYDFPTMNEFVDAKIFQDRSLKDIWELISIYSFNGIDIEEYFA